MMGLAQWVVLIVALLRVAELIYSNRNTARLLARGGIEYGQRHYPLFVVLHSGWLMALFFGIPGQNVANIYLLILFALLQFIRGWVITSLGPYWSTRIISSPEFPRIIRGPYRWVKHPNYLVVTAEIAVLPLAFGAWEIALVFSLLNAALLAWRIRIEEIHLRERLSNE